MATASVFRAHMEGLGKRIDANSRQERVGGDLSRIGLFANSSLRVGVQWFFDGDDFLRGHVAISTFHPRRPRILDALAIGTHHKNSGTTWLVGRAPTDPSWRVLNEAIALEDLSIYERHSQTRLEVPSLDAGANPAEVDEVLAQGAVLLSVGRRMQFAGLMANKEVVLY